MGLESDPKDGKVVAGSVFWAVLVYAVRRSSFLLSFFPFFGGRHLQPVLLSPFPPPPSSPTTCPEWWWGKKTTRSNSEGMEIRFSSSFVGFKQFYITERVSGGLYR